MTDENRKKLPVFKLAAAAIVLGALVGTAAVYMKNSGSGNAQQVATGDCESTETIATALKPVIHGQVAALIPANPPRPIDGLAFNGPDGKPMSLADFKGKTVVLNLWATWCFPCRAEMPELDALQKGKGADGKLEVAAINIDTGDDSKPKAFRTENGINTVAFYRDNTLGTFNKLKKEGLAVGLPATLVFNSKGCLVASMNGPAAWNSDDAHAFLDAVEKL